MCDFGVERIRPMGLCQPRKALLLLSRPTIRRLDAVRCCLAFSNETIVIVNFKLLKRHSKAKRRAPAYSRALRQIRGVFQRIVRGRLRSVFQIVRECVKSEVFSKE